MDKQAQALAKMQAANAALTPEERKARSAKAAAASKAAAEARKAGAVDGKAPAAPVTDAAPLPNRVWRVTLVVSTEAGKRGAWACPDVSAPTIKRAVREARAQARSLHPEFAVEAVAGVFDRDLAKVGAIAA